MRSVLIEANKISSQTGRYRRKSNENHPEHIQAKLERGKSCAIVMLNADMGARRFTLTETHEIFMKQEIHLKFRG